MNNLPNAEQSPRIVNGVLKWYEGDTFDLQFSFNLADQDDVPMDIAPIDEVDIVFKNKRLKTVKQFHFTGIFNNLVTMNFDAECSALFPAGQYTYDVYYSSQERTTVIKDNKVVVE